MGNPFHLSSARSTCGGDTRRDGGRQRTRTRARASSPAREHLVDVVRGLLSQVGEFFKVRAHAPGIFGAPVLEYRATGLVSCALAGSSFISDFSSAFLSLFLPFYLPSGGPARAQQGLLARSRR